MSALTKRIRSATYSVELADADVFEKECMTIPGICWDFFHESQYSGVAKYDPVMFGFAMRRTIESGHRCVFLGRVDGEVVGMLSVDFAKHFTTEPLAHLFLIYVKPEWRASPLGRMLTLAAVALAKAKNITAFYAGITSGISESNTHRLGNMFRRLGFSDVGITLKMTLRA